MRRATRGCEISRGEVRCWFLGMATKMFGRIAALVRRRRKEREPTAHPTLSMRDLVELLYRRHGHEVRSVIERVTEHSAVELARHKLDGGTSSSADCVFLYLLIRAFSRRNIFEIGTYIGTTAVAMGIAARATGGVVATCDPKNYTSIPSDLPIEFLRGRCAKVLKHRACAIDMVFADWIPNNSTMARLNALATPDLIFTCHDYDPINQHDKGNDSVRQFQRTYRHINSGYWFYPESDYIVVDGVGVQLCTAAFLPASIVERLAS
jgi:hypothetical protein